MAHDVFLTYSRKDQATADAACAALERDGVRVWMAPRDILPGADWPASIIAAINTARAMVLIFSSHANDSTQVKREVERAVSKGLPIIPFRIEDVPLSPTLEYLISADQWLDAFAPNPRAHLEQLSAAARQLLDRMPAPPVTADEPPPTASQPAGETPSRRALPTWLIAAVVTAAVVVVLGWWWQARRTGTPTAPDTAAPTQTDARSRSADGVETRFKDIREQKLLGYDPNGVRAGGRVITIAVLGTGVSPAMSQALGSRLQASSVVPGEPDPEDLHGLGTSVIALVAALAPSAKIHAIKTFSASGLTVPKLLGDGIEKAAREHAEVIFVDGGSPHSSPEDAAAVQAALAAGSLVVAPAGNDGKNELRFPAAYPGVLAIGALGADGTRAEFSNYGPGVLLAPGVDVRTIDESAKAVQRSGTSLSSAVGAAMVGVVWAARPKLSAPEIRDLVRTTAISVGPAGARDQQSSALRRIDVAAALARDPDTARSASRDACERECRRDYSNCNISTVNDATAAARDACQVQLRNCEVACAER